MTAPAAGAPTARPVPDGGARRGWLPDLARAAAAPAGCAAVLIGLLSAWVAIGGGGTISRVRIQVTLAAIPMTSFTGDGVAGQRVRAYVTIRNRSARPDELTGVTSPGARRVILTRQAGGARAVPRLAVPARGVLTLSPFGSDVVLIGTKRLTDGQHVPLTLSFRDAGRITVEAKVTAPGVP